MSNITIILHSTSLGDRFRCLKRKGSITFYDVLVGHLFSNISISGTMLSIFVYFYYDYSIFIVLNLIGDHIFMQSF